MTAASFSWHDLLRYAHTWIYLLKWPLAFIAGWSGLFYRRWRKSRDEQAAQGWPSAEGRIIGVTVTQVPKTTRFLATLEYSFFLTEYHYGKYTHEFGNESDANEFARQMKEKRVPIRYKDSDPDRSVLEQRAVEQHILLAPRFG